MGGIRIYIYKLKNVAIVKKGGKKDISVVNNIFSNREIKRRKSDIYVSDDSWGVRVIGVGSNKG